MMIELGGIVGDNRTGEVSGCKSGATFTTCNAVYFTMIGGIAGMNGAKLIGNLADGVQMPDFTGMFFNGAIAGTYSGTLKNNFYTNCNIGGKVVESGIGVGATEDNMTPHDISKDNGAMPLSPDLIIEGDSENTVVIGESEDNQTVTYRRSFQKDITATVILPFDFKASKYFKGKGTFHTLDEVKYDEDASQWIAKASDPIEDIQANTPYIFKPTADFNVVTFTGVDVKENIGLSKSVSPKDFSVATKADGWSLVGVYSYKTWAVRTPNEYGFAAKPISYTDEENGEEVNITAGEFVRAGKDAKIKPTRAYLRYDGEDETLKSKSSAVLPDRIVLVFPSETASAIDDPSDDPSGSDDIETPTSEIQPTANVKVWSYSKTIYIAAAPGTAYRIIDINGRPLRTGITATDRDEIHLGGKADGIVIVIIGGKAFKIRY
jgi:hypothetical protein